MNLYLVIKWLHILSATVLFGTGIGIAFFKWSTDRSGDVRAIRIVAERTVTADWIFTTPAVIIQPISGLGMMVIGHYPIYTGWIVLGTGMYLVAGACWLPVVWLQLKMRDIARAADGADSQLPPKYWKLTKSWFWLGVPAFSALVAVYWLMVFKPDI